MFRPHLRTQKAIFIYNRFQKPNRRKRHADAPRILLGKKNLTLAFNVINKNHTGEMDRKIR